MATKGLSGPGLTMLGGGAFLVYMGIKGSNPLDELRALASGQRPEPLSKESKSRPLQGGDFGGGDFSGTGNTVGGGSGGAAIANAAKRYIGTPYRWGGTNPETGLDCSGLVWRVFTQDLHYPAKGFPRTTAGIIVSNRFRRISRSECGAGDLTWWPGHVGIAINNSQGVYAPRAGTKVQIQDIDRGPGLVCLRYVGPSANYREGLLRGPR